MAQVSYTNFGKDAQDFAAEQRSLESRKRLAEAMQAQSQQAIGPGQMVGRFYVGPSWSQGAAQLGKALFAGSQLKDIAGAEKDLAGRRSQALAEALQGMPRAKQEELPPDVMGPPQTMQPGMGDYAKWFGDLSRVGPEAVQMGGTLLGMQNRNEQRQEDRDFRAQQAQMQREQRMQELQLRLQDQRLNAQDRMALSRELAQMQADMRRDLAQFTVANRPPVAPSVTQVVDPNNPRQMLTIDARQYRGGTVGAPGVIGIAGKEPVTAKREEKEGQGKELLKSEIDNLRVLFDELDKTKAIPSSERGALSNAASWLQNTTVGQMGGRIIGSKEQDARNQIQSSRLRLLNAIKNATGMSAQQLNSNAELKTWLDSLTNMEGSVESNKAILDQIENAFLKGGKVGASPAAAQSDEPPPGAVRPRGQ